MQMYQQRGMVLVLEEAYKNYKAYTARDHLKRTNLITAGLGSFNKVVRICTCENQSWPAADDQVTGDHTGPT